MFPQALGIIEEFGYEGVSLSDLLKLTSRMILRSELSEDEELLALASEVYRQGKYDEVILEYLAACEDREVTAMKRTLSQNVPYRLQAPFMESMKGKEWSRSGKNLAERINQEQRLMYYFLPTKENGR